MAKRLTRLRRLNDAKPEVIESELLKESPEGLPEAKAAVEEDEVVVADYIPEMRKVIFINGRDPGQELMFHYHSKTHPLKHYTLFHGKEYILPVEIIDHLETRSEPVYGYRTAFSGHPEMYVKSQKYIFSCKPVRGVA